MTSWHGPPGRSSPTSPTSVPWTSTLTPATSVHAWTAVSILPYAAVNWPTTEEFPSRDRYGVSVPQVERRHLHESAELPLPNRPADGLPGGKGLSEQQQLARIVPGWHSQSAGHKCQVNVAHRCVKGRHKVSVSWWHAVRVFLVWLWSLYSVAMLLRNGMSAACCRYILPRLDKHGKLMWFCSMNLFKF